MGWYFLLTPGRMAFGFPRFSSLGEHGPTGLLPRAGLAGHPCPADQSLLRRSASFTGVSKKHRPFGGGKTYQV